MAIYTVHEPPLRAGDERTADRFVFVRDGFVWSAFLFAPLWMVRHRLWLALLLYLIAAALIGAAAHFLRLSAETATGIAFLFSLLVGFEASTLRRWTLVRGKWANVGVVVAGDLDLAEHRFFDAWLRQGAPSRSGSPASGSGVRSTAATDVIGLFPQPGGRG